MIGLMGTKITSNLGLKILINFIHVVHHQDVFGGNGTVGFQLEAPMAVRVLKVEEAIPCSYKRLKELFFKKGMTELAQRLCQVLTFNGFFHNRNSLSI